MTINDLCILCCQIYQIYYSMSDLCVQVDNEISNMIQHRYLRTYSFTILLINYPTYSLSTYSLSYSFTTLLIHYPTYSLSYSFTHPLLILNRCFPLRIPLIFFIFFINNIYYFLHLQKRFDS